MKKLMLCVLFALLSLANVSIALDMGTLINTKAHMNGCRYDLTMYGVDATWLNQTDLSLRIAKQDGRGMFMATEVISVSPNNNGICRFKGYGKPGNKFMMGQPLLEWQTKIYQCSGYVPFIIVSVIGKGECKVIRTMD